MANNILVFKKSFYSNIKTIETAIDKLNQRKKDLKSHYVEFSNLIGVTQDIIIFKIKYLNTVMQIDKEIGILETYLNYLKDISEEYKKVQVKELQKAYMLL